MNAFDIPELAALNAPRQIIRIPNQVDVPVTNRILKLIDAPAFQRLKSIGQLGVVAAVYPGARHNRFEHSLGVYRNALLFLRQLQSLPEFRAIVDQQSVTALIAAALLHDVGHWPFCHPIEDLNLDKIPKHEKVAAQYIRSEPVASILRDDFGVEPDLAIRLISNDGQTKAEALLCSILSGPIDVDKMDYLYRDSLHAGVPYGQNFDSSRLIASLCLNHDQTRLGITHKGKTAAELMVFARYVMFSEVYWHHAVRSATAMLQRAFFLVANSFSQNEFLQLASLGDQKWVETLIARSGQQSTTAKLLNHIFGDARQLYKRVASFSFLDQKQVYEQLAHRPYDWLVTCGSAFANRLGQKLDQPVDSHDVLIDAPPIGLEVQFDVSVSYGPDKGVRRLGDVSPVVKTLATEQFDHLVKQVRVFCKPELVNAIQEIDVESILNQAISDSN